MEIARPESPITVFELTTRIKSRLETEFTNIVVIGEVSNYKLHSSGHIYFTLKDDKSQINCTLWRSKAAELKFNLENGLQVIIWGGITVYERGGSYQINVRSLHHAGLGDLQLRFEQLKRRLNEEGLFRTEHKKPIPSYPARIGVITSRTGAAIRDIIQIINRRNPGVEIILYPVKVQGEGAAEEIAAAIAAMNQPGIMEEGIDLLIVGRGGGSLEDLWAFNEEIVARAIYGSSIPIISAVGHEIDFTIADFAADLRAPTPSAAAELAVRDVNELRDLIHRHIQKMINNLAFKLKLYRERINRINRSIAFDRPMDFIQQHARYIDDLTGRLQTNLHYRLNQSRQRLELVERHLNSLNPRHILQRGYSITRDPITHHVITSPDQVSEGQLIQTILQKGEIQSRVTPET
ncbi:MAG: exodeoxyribonuclease VII large subunit [Candidatus Delongbacteria bacterium]|nr:exodeoxyribonuclease VII large subunit [Candidatus Delongbacteria bacterium]